MSDSSSEEEEMDEEDDDDPLRTIADRISEEGNTVEDEDQVSNHYQPIFICQKKIQLLVSRRI